MIRSGSKLLGAFFVAVSLVPANVPAAVTNQVPDFAEVYDLLRTNLPGVTEEQLNRAAVQGLLEHFRGKAALFDDQTPDESTKPVLIKKTTVIENQVAYVRVENVASGLAKAVGETFNALSKTNELKGVVLDLRFAAGTDYESAAATADLFLSKERPLLDWGEGMKRSDEKEDAIRLPVAVLVNSETIGAAEALAAVLRESSAGLLLGSTTSGSAMVAREFPLSDGQRLRIATLPVKLGDGTAVSVDGVKPDVEVALSRTAELAYLDDPYAILGRPTTTNNSPVASLMRRPRISEADLVRERREGTNLNVEEFTAARDREPEKPLIRDPVLARAVDLLKGLAVVRRTRS